MFFTKSLSLIELTNPAYPSRVKVDFGTKELVGGMESIEWGPVEVYSSSDGTEDSNEDNNRGK